MRNDAGQLSFRFLIGKLALLAVLIVLIAAAWRLWDYDTTDDTDTANVATTQETTTTTPTETATTETTPAETTEPTEATPAAFPFSFDDKKTADDFPGIDTDFLEFTYTFDTNATVQVGREGIATQSTLSRDFVWTYTVAADGSLNLASTPITFCSDSPTCGLGNGVMEVIVEPAASSDATAVFYIKDSGNVTEFTAVDKYTPLLESYQEVQGEES